MGLATQHALASVAAIGRRPPLESALHRCGRGYDDWGRDTQRYDRELSRGMAKIPVALELEERERMSAEVQVFLAALEHDLIDAGDFASS